MLTAIGTFGAVVVSLWLAKYDRKPNLYIYTVITDEKSGQDWHHIIEIKNLGTISTRIVSEGITPFKNRKWHEPFMSIESIGGEDDSYSDTFDSGQEFTIIIEEEEFNRTWKKCYLKFKKKKYYIYVENHTGRAHYEPIYFSINDIDK
ncbi:hypothetical protein [Marinilactibacillus piezotolerans]|uniref:hypothetical protein n=1 Tax=Marinilactibacillus piezotolerans TaxID=258723 RepID=UPI001180A9A1|nr:hypothetical protein [Marinilactibacillus piezotolerans]